MSSLLLAKRIRSLSTSSIPAVEASIDLVPAGGLTWPTTSASDWPPPQLRAPTPPGFRLPAPPTLQSLHEDRPVTAAAAGKRMQPHASWPGSVPSAAGLHFGGLGGADAGNYRAGDTLASLYARLPGTVQQQLLAHDSYGVGYDGREAPFAGGGGGRPPLGAYRNSAPADLQQELRSSGLMGVRSIGSSHSGGGGSGSGQFADQHLGGASASIKALAAEWGAAGNPGRHPADLLGYSDAGGGCAVAPPSDWARR